MVHELTVIKKKRGHEFEGEYVGSFGGRNVLNTFSKIKIHFKKKDNGKEAQAKGTLCPQPVTSPLVKVSHSFSQVSCYYPVLLFWEARRKIIYSTPSFFTVLSISNQLKNT